MMLISFSFLVFAAVAVALYYLFPLRYRWVALLLASGFFVYRSNGWYQAIVMIFMIAAAWGAGSAIERNRERKIYCRAVAAGTIALLAGMLVVLKEGHFFYAIARDVCGLFRVPFVAAEPDLSIWTPWGISYFALVLISYVVEIFCGTAEAEKNPLKFAAFAGFFPLLTSGPIIKYNDSYREIVDGHRASYENLCFGAQRILWGFFKKLVLSERLAVIVNTVYGAPTDYPGLYTVLAFCAFTLQLYTDFSGCIDICLGVAEAMGIRLPENFDLPFLAESLEEFWRRWHITLGAWLRAYILYPVLKSALWQRLGAWSGRSLQKIFGRRIAKKFPVWCGLMVSWFLVGFWHGGAYHYIFGVGLLQGVLIILGDLCSPLFVRLTKALRINTDCFSWRLFRRVRTFALFTMGVSMFRAPTLGTGVFMWRAAFTWNPWTLFDGSLYALGGGEGEVRVLFAAILILLVAGLMRVGRGRQVRACLAGQNLLFRWMMYIGLFFFVVVYGEYGPNYDAAAFIYERF